MIGASPRLPLDDAVEAGWARKGASEWCGGVWTIIPILGTVSQQALVRLVITSSSGWMVSKWQAFLGASWSTGGGPRTVAERR